MSESAVPAVPAVPAGAPAELPATQHAIQFTGPGQLVHNRAKPVLLPGPTQLLCRVEAVSICFSDTKLLKAFTSHLRKAAVTSGGLWGKGLTNGTGGLPAQVSDFVWGVLAQELGFFGSMVVLALFVALMWRLLVCAWRSNDTFALLIGCGLASMLLFQVFVNIGMVIGIMPITGIPLPFITYGGASLVSLMGGLGVMQSTNLRREPPAW